MADTDSEEDQCRVITEIALKKGMENCASDEAIKRQLADLVGYPADRDLPECEFVLGDGLEAADFKSQFQLREWVLCRAWQLVESGQEPFRGAVQQAWAEVDDSADITIVID